eukprot:gene26858-33504_t
MTLKSLLAIFMCMATASAAAQELTGTLAKIKRTGTITLGVRDGSVPFSYLDDKQQYIGYSVDLCMKIVTAAQKQLGLTSVKVMMNPVTPANRIPLMANGTIDLECGSATNNAERQKQEVELQKEAVEQAHRNISVLSEIGREMSATLDIEKAMRTLYRHVRHLMDTHMFGVGFYREEEGILEFPFSMERGVRSLPYSRDVQDPDQLAVWCWYHRHDIFINDFFAEYSRYMGPAGLEKLKPVPLADGSEPDYAQSMLYTPLIVNDRVVGVLSVQSKEKNAYRQVHLDMLQTLAAHAAVSLDNALAYQRLEETLQELRETQGELMQQQAKVRLHTEELAL